MPGNLIERHGSSDYTTLDDAEDYNNSNDGVINWYKSIQHGTKFSAICNDQEIHSGLCI